MQVRLGLALPPPFTLVPRLLVQSAAGAVMRSVTQLVVNPNPNPNPYPNPNPRPGPSPSPNPNQVTQLVVPQFVTLLEKDCAR